MLLVLLLVCGKLYYMLLESYPKSENLNIWKSKIWKSENLKFENLKIKKSENLKIWKFISFIFLCRCEFEDFPVTTNRFCKNSIYRKVIVLEIFGGKYVSHVSTKLSKISKNVYFAIMNENENPKSVHIRYI